MIYVFTLKSVSLRCNLHLVKFALISVQFYEF